MGREAASKLGEDSRFSNTNVLLSRTPGGEEANEWAVGEKRMEQAVDAGSEDRNMRHLKVDQKGLQHAFVSTQLVPGSSFGL